MILLFDICSLYLTSKFCSPGLYHTIWNFHFVLQCGHHFQNECHSPWRWCQYVGTYLSYSCSSQCGKNSQDLACRFVAVNAMSDVSWWGDWLKNCHIVSSSVIMAYLLIIGHFPCIGWMIQKLNLWLKFTFMFNRIISFSVKEVCPPILQLLHVMFWSFPMKRWVWNLIKIHIQFYRKCLFFLKGDRSCFVTECSH